MENKKGEDSKDLIPAVPVAKQEEVLLIGWIMVHGCKDDKLFDVISILDPADFWDSKGQIIFRAVKQVIHNGDKPDIVNLYQEIEQINKLAKEVKIDAGTLAWYSTEYANGTYFSDPVATAKRIKEIALLRRSISFFRQNPIS